MNNIYTFVVCLNRHVQKASVFNIDYILLHRRGANKLYNTP